MQMRVCRTFSGVRPCCVLRVGAMRITGLAQVGDVAHDERGALAPAAAFVGSQTLHGLKGDLDHVVEGFKEKNLVQSQ